MWDLCDWLCITPFCHTSSAQLSAPVASPVWSLVSPRSGVKSVWLMMLLSHWQSNPGLASSFSTLWTHILILDTPESYLPVSPGSDVTSVWPMMLSSLWHSDQGLAFSSSTLRTRNHPSLPDLMSGSWCSPALQTLTRPGPRDTRTIILLCHPTPVRPVPGLVPGDGSPQCPMAQWV